MAKLVAIGDSITQGFMSGAISSSGAKFSYPALIAKAMGLKVWQPCPNNEAPNHENIFRVPYFPGSGLPLNIEALLRAIGPDFDGPLGVEELQSRFSSISEFIDETRESYDLDQVDYQGIYHNLAVLSFRVSDSFTINSTYYDQESGENENAVDGRFDGWSEALSIVLNTATRSEMALSAIRWITREMSDVLGTQPSVFVGQFLSRCLDYLPDILDSPPTTMYRVARHVLNPSRSPNRDCWTQISNLKHIMKTEGVENLILFLGANDCLNTVTGFDIEDMPPESGISDDPEARRRYNLTSENVFKKDYSRMVRQISEIISADTRVFVGTIPYVTIPPITQASNQLYREHRGKQYFTYYAPFFADRENWRGSRLDGEQAISIDTRIHRFNEIIRGVIQTVPENGEWHLVDICGLLERLAVRRTDNDSDPSRPLRNFLPSDHALLGDNLSPVPNVLRFETHNNERTNGGFFSLDCFHPTTIGQGLIAEAFVSVMREAGVCHISSGANDWELNWGRIIENDTLIEDPPVLWDDAIRMTEEYRGLASVIYSLFA